MDNFYTSVHSGTGRKNRKDLPASIRKPGKTK